MLSQKAQELGSQPAFPCVCMEAYTNGEVINSRPFDSGLTKREYYAGLAMQEILHALESDVWITENVSERSINQADALLEELAREQQGEPACLPEKVYDNPLDDPNVPF